MILLLIKNELEQKRLDALAELSQLGIKKWIWGINDKLYCFA